jgi:hypothetical protein
MKKLIGIFIITVLTLLFFKNNTLADTGSSELIEKGKKYDRQLITYNGEIIGDPMSRGDYVWLNVKDKDNAMGVWVKKEQLPKIKYYGCYKSIGDTLVIRGTFHRSCIEHGGDMDIHANIITVSEAGHAVKYPVQMPRLIIAIIFLVTAGLTYYLYKYRKNC